VTIKLLRKI